MDWTNAFGKGLIPGLFGGSGDPYKQAGEQYKKYSQQGINTQNPFYQQGVNALPQYSDWVNGQKDPAKFMNDLQGQYKQSNYYDFLNQQGQNGITNQASAQGLIGSTPYQQAGTEFAQQNAQSGMSDWLKNVLGINTQYGQGLGNEIGTGQHAADQISQLLQQLGINMGDAKYGQKAGQQADANSIWGSLASLFM